MKIERHKEKQRKEKKPESIEEKGGKGETQSEVRNGRERRNLERSEEKEMGKEKPGED